MQRAPFTTRPFLTDGGVYDNLGLEPVWERYETILITDGGGHMGDQEKPKRFWPLQAFRVLGVIDNQVRGLRKREAIEAFLAGRRKGAYWGIGPTSPTTTCRRRCPVRTATMGSRRRRPVSEA